MNLKEDKQKVSEAFFQGMNTANIATFGIIKENFEVVKSVYPLVIFIINRLCTVTNLAMQGHNWDAEIIYRSALEGIIKFAFIVSGDEEERKIRIKEFWDDLSEINSIKMSEQAKKNIALFEDNEIYRLTFQPLILPEEKEKELRKKWPRDKRKNLEHKWSFSEMIAVLSKNYLGVASPFFIGFGHNYRYASHVAHADETGILIIDERNQRPQEDKDVADFAHFFRIMSDSFQFCIALGIQVSILAKKDLDFFLELQKSLSEISDIGKLYQQELQKDESYNKYRENEHSKGTI